jgi:hypothetical protein
MNRRQMMLSGLALAARPVPAQTPQGQPRQEEAPTGSPPTLLLKDYRPVSLYKIQTTNVKKARHTVFDVHCHGARPISKLDDWVKLMDTVGVEKSVIFTGASTPERFEQVAKPYAKYPDRFDMWCSFDMAGVNEPGFGPGAVKSLVGCHQLGAKGVGELSDKGRGIGGRGGSAGDAMLASLAQANGAPRRPPAPSMGAHPDDPRLDALWDKCGELGIPINIHISDPIWAYGKMDKTNEALMMSWTWKINLEPGMYNHLQLIESLENAVKNHRKTTFIACHLANLEYDLARLSGTLDRNPNLFADISARFVETATIPRAMNKFLRKYHDRVLYGTDLGYSEAMFSQTFRIIETSDEHFYQDYSDFLEEIYQWPLSGFDLPDDVVKKIYHDNAVAVFRRAQTHAA